MIFPYVRHQVDKLTAIPSGEIARPEIPIRVFGPAGSIDSVGLLDTGADQVFLPVVLAEMLGVEIDADGTESVEGAGGHELPMWPAAVELEIVSQDRSYRWRVETGFIEAADDVAAAYLGQAGFLEYFRATFDGNSQTVELIPTDRLERYVQKTHRANREKVGCKACHALAEGRRRRIWRSPHRTGIAIIGRRKYCTRRSRPNN